ncbi:MAG: hypothetical protein CVV58_00155 [Tenericutes bacterium HGW-Tenericutes-3]|nr:MAG: hypothetical protein CVV58_00155 [Tenericutes bacterium HGW-Tenericutes-3]
MFSLLKVRIKRKKNIKIIVIRVIIFMLLIIPGLFIYGFGVALVENTKVNQAIEEFKSRANGIYTEEVLDFGGTLQTRRYYEVSRETSYELNDTRSVFYDDNRIYLGQKGDIFLAHESPFPNVPVIHQFISYYFGGHAAINNGENRFIEATGFPEDDESLLEIILQPGDEPNDYSTTMSLSSTNYWLNPRYRKETDEEYPYFGSNYRNNFAGLRVKDITSEQIDGAVDFAASKVNVSLYNFTFFLDLEYKYYCTDLVSRAYQDVMVEPEDQRNYSRALNDDRFITSVNDLILSKETYLIFYVENIDNITNIYYLEDI